MYVSEYAFGSLVSTTDTTMAGSESNNPLLCAWICHKNEISIGLFLLYVHSASLGRAQRDPCAQERVVRFAPTNHGVRRKRLTSEGGENKYTTVCATGVVARRRGSADPHTQKASY